MDHAVWHEPEQFSSELNNISLCSKLVASRDKKVNQAARDSNDALVCFVVNTIEDRIIDSYASFHATYCKEESERFKLRFGRVRLADDKTLDIAGVWDVILKTSFGTSWTLKDVRIGMSMLASKGNVLDVWKVKCLKFDNGGEYSSGLIKFCVKNRIVMLKMVPKTPLRFGVAERLSRTFRAEITRIRAKAPKMLWADSVSSSSDKMQYSFQDTKSHQVIRSRDITFVDSIYGAKSVTDSSSLTKPIQKIQVVLVDISYNLALNDSILAELGLSLEITQSPGGSSDTSEGSENSRSFEDSGRSHEEYFKDGASSKEGGFETLQERRSIKEPKASVRYSSSANYLLLTENGKLNSYSEALSSKESIQ
nr:putative ribonuclease H-like domain, GAG-pre-integrase domain protein [Tanacetum cinerariifolium]